VQKWSLESSLPSFNASETNLEHSIMKGYTALDEQEVLLCDVPIFLQDLDRALIDGFAAYLPAVVVGAHDEMFFTNGRNFWAHFSLHTLVKDRLCVVLSVTTHPAYIFVAPVLSAVIPHALPD